MKRLLLSLVIAFRCLLAQTAAFPSAVVTDTQLMKLANRVQSNLTAGATATDTVLHVVSGSRFQVPGLVTIDSEIVAACAVNGNDISVGVASCPNLDGRGFDSTSSASHTINSAVTMYVDAWHHNAVAAELKAIETALGVNLANVVTPSTLVALIPSPTPVNKGGTNATTAAAARSNLGAAASGANSDITALSALSTAITVLQGGTGAATLTGIVQGKGTGTMGAIAAASERQVLRRKPNMGATVTYEFATPPDTWAADFDFPAQTNGVEISSTSLAAGNNSVTTSLIPQGVNGSDGQHYLYVSGGTGSAEACKINGGSGVAGSAGTIILNCANTHTGAWTMRSASGGIKEASVALGGVGIISVGNAAITIYGPLVLPTAISLRALGFSKVGTSGAGGAVLTCTTGANPCLIPADGIGLATGQGMGEYSGFKLYGPGSGAGLHLGGDPSNVYAPSTWSASYTRYRNISVENFADACTIDSEANFVEFDHVVCAGLTRALYIPSTAVSLQPIVFYGGLFSVPTGNAIQQDYNGFMTTQLNFVGSQISGTVTGSQVALYAQDVHWEPNEQGAALVNISNNQQNDLRIVGGLLSVHGGGAFGGSTPPYVINASGAGLHNITLKDVTVQTDLGSTVAEVINFTPTLGGRLVLENVNRLSAGTFTKLRVYTPSNPAGHVVRQPEWANQTVAAASTLAFPESNFPDAGVLTISGATVGGSGITAVTGLIAGQTGKLICINAQTFTAGATIAATVTLSAVTLHSYYYDGTHIFIQ